ncbi:MAG TPA: hypothetical protein VF163_17655 [Micromonosporaceae bacterium]
MDGLAYLGVVDLPTATGSVRTLSFSLERAAHVRFSLRVADADAAFTTRSDTLVLQGDVLLYLTRLSGTLNGEPVTFTPDSPPASASSQLTMTDVTMDLVYLGGTTLAAPSLLADWAA